MEKAESGQTETDTDMMRRARDVLYRIFGYTRFRPGQKRVIQALLDRRDVFAMMPTGGGKSLCYQLPGYILSGMVLVVSPLLSLMEDQVDSLRRIGEKKVRALNSMLHSGEKRSILRHLNELRFLFISPEMLRRPAVLSALERVPVSLFVVDEAHCISQWGHEFRPDYLHLADVRTRLGSPVCLALTATADFRVRQDIIRHLHLDQGERLLQSVDRRNIALIVRQVADSREKIEQLLQLIATVRLPGIVYCSSRDWTEKIAEVVRTKLNLRAAFYHGGMTAEDRRSIQNQFLNHELDVLCCTNAFGMGINKPDVRLVVHFHYPRSLNDYLQEIGRAARDGGQGLAVLYYCKEDDRLPAAFIDSNYPSAALLRAALERMDRECLRPGDEERFTEIMKSAGAGETASRFVLEQIRTKQEGAAYLSLMDPCMKLIHLRRTEQLRDLDKMRRWIFSKECRRRSCLRFFGEELPEKPVLCCDRCGADIDDFRRDPSEARSGGPELHWEKRLRRLLVRKED